MSKYHLHIGSALDVLRTLPGASVHCCVTSPPYWGLRDYGVTGQIGLEPTPEEFVEKIVAVFREVKRVLRDDGTLWLNLGDSYGRNAAKGQHKPGDSGKPNYIYDVGGGRASAGGLGNGVKEKDLVGIPWAVAFALRADGWYLRQAIPWIKKNGMPESTKDRPVIGVEYIFLLSKSVKYHYDHTAVMKVADGDTHARYARGRSESHKWKDGGPGNQTIAKSMAHMTAKRPAGVNPKAAMNASGSKQNASFSEAIKDVVENRMRRVSDWFFESFQGLLGDENGDPLAMVVNSKGFSGAHFAVFPPDMVEPCILAGCPKGGTVLDPFAGSGTTGIVALNHFRRFVGIELNPEYADEIARPRLEAEAQRLKQTGLFDYNHALVGDPAGATA